MGGADRIICFKKDDTVICYSGFSTDSGKQVKITNAVLDTEVSVRLQRWMKDAKF